MARKRRPMSAATKAKISAAQKGNKNAYKGGPKANITYGKRDANGVKYIRNKGYGKRRAAANLLGGASGVAAGLAYNSHKTGLAKRRALKSNKLLVTKRAGRKGKTYTNVYVPHSPRPAGRRKKK